MEALSINASKVRQHLVDFIRLEVARTGLTKVVLGLSGGIDSALVCHLAAEAMGADNVHAICLPYKSSNPDSETHARQVAADCGVKFEVISITPMVDAYFSNLPEADMLRRGNYMSRTRMAVLFDHSALYNALVLGTSNKTELLLGYCTIYGDLAAAINPIGELYKTQVWQLSRELGVAREVIEKVPSGDLWEGQSDEEELGLSYAEVDRLLVRMVDQKQGREQLVAAGFSPQYIDDVCSRIERYSFKRRLPLIASLQSLQTTYHPPASPL